MTAENFVYLKLSIEPTLVVPFIILPGETIR